MRKVELSGTKTSVIILCTVTHTAIFIFNVYVKVYCIESKNDLLQKK